MTNIYIRVKRAGVWTKVEIEHATAKERNQYINSLPSNKRGTLINKLCKVIRDVKDD